LTAPVARIERRGRVILARYRKVVRSTPHKEQVLGRGARKATRWNKDRQRKKKARDERKIVDGKAAKAAEAAAQK
jgi:hypothetical protein